MKLRIRTVRPGGPPQVGDEPKPRSWPAQLVDPRAMPPVLRGQEVRVEDAETGILLDGVQSVTWHCGGRGERPVCVLTFLGVAVDVDADLSPEASAAVMLARSKP